MLITTRAGMLWWTTIGLSLASAIVLKCSNDRAPRRLVVVRRHDQEAVDAERVGLLRQVHGVRRSSTCRPRDHRCPVADGVDRRREERQAFFVRQRRRLAGRSCNDDAVRAVVDQNVQSSMNLRTSIAPRESNGVTAAARTSPSTSGVYDRSLSSPTVMPGGSAERWPARAEPWYAPCGTWCRAGSSASGCRRRRSPPGARAGLAGVVRVDRHVLPHPARCLARGARRRTI